MRAIVAVAVVALVLAACGDDDADTEPTTTTSSPDTTSTTSTTSLSDQPEPVPAADAVELEADVPSQVDAGPVAWKLKVTNVTDDQIVLTFPTAQPGDAVLLDDGQEVHRWSDGRFFAQVIQEKSVAAGESFTIQLEDDISSVEPGTYTLRLSLAVVGPPEPVEQTVRVVSDG